MICRYVWYVRYVGAEQCVYCLLLFFATNDESQFVRRKHVLYLLPKLYFSQKQLPENLARARYDN